MQRNFTPLFLVVIIVRGAAAVEIYGNNGNSAPGVCDSIQAGGTNGGLVSGVCHTATGEIATCAENGDVAYHAYSNTDCTGTVTEYTVGNNNGTNCIPQYISGQ